VSAEPAPQTPLDASEQAPRLVQQAICGQVLGLQVDPATPREPPLVQAPFTDMAQAPRLVQQATCGQGLGEQEPPHVNAPVQLAGATEVQAPVVEQQLPTHGEGVQVLARPW
jgi:hypothetical protein